MGSKKKIAPSRPRKKNLLSRRMKQLRAQRKLAQCSDDKEDRGNIENLGDDVEEAVVGDVEGEASSVKTVSPQMSSESSLT